MFNFRHKRKKASLFRMLIADILIAALIIFGDYTAVYTDSISTLELPFFSALSDTNTQESQTDDTTSDKGTQENTTVTTDWSKKFADHFTNEVVSTDTSYTSSDLSVSVTKHVSGSGDDQITYYVADIYMANLASFQTAFAGGTYESSNKEELTTLSDELNAILAVNGDSYNFNLNHLNGLLVRNSEVYRTNSTTSDICILYKSGVMSTYTPEEFDINNVDTDDIYQSWVFGPSLLDESGNAKTEFNTSDYLRKSHPRTAIGYYEPGHYCLVVVDGRQTGYSKGMTLEELSSVFADLGCSAAYNLDGGHTSSMVLNSETVSQPFKSGQTVSDGIFLCEPDTK